MTLRLDRQLAVDLEQIADSLNVSKAVLIRRLLRVAAANARRLFHSDIDDEPPEGWL